MNHGSFDYVNHGGESYASNRRRGEGETASEFDACAPLLVCSVDHEFAQNCMSWGVHSMRWLNQY